MTRWDRDLQAVICDECNVGRQYPAPINLDQLSFEYEQFVANHRSCAADARIGRALVAMRLANTGGAL